MILYLIRLLLLLLLIFVIIVDFNLPIIIHTSTNQLIIGIIVIFLILVVDEIIGFLVGLIFLIIYFKYYQKKINNTKPYSPSLLQSPSSSLSLSSLTPYSLFNNDYQNDKTNITPKAYSIKPEIPDHYISEINNDNENCTIIPYISNELLKSAQNNIYSEENYKMEIKQDNYYGIQGLNTDNSNYLAFDNNFTNFSDYSP
jgi:hypothetical protein